MKLAILTNILTPYRKFMYDQISHYCKEQGWGFYVLVMSAGEPNRHWTYDQYKTDYTILLDKRIIYKKNYVSGFYSNNLGKKLRDIAPDVVVAGGAYIMLPVLQAIFYKRKYNYRLFYWSESNLVKKEFLSVYKSFLRELVRKVVYRRFDGFWNAGKYSDEFIRKYKRKKAPSYFIPNLVDSELFSQIMSTSADTKCSIKKKYSLAIDRKIILIPARLSVEKGIIDFLQLYEAANNKNETILLIAGDGPQINEIATFIESSAADVRLLGYKSQEEMLDLYSITDIFVLPSFQDPNPLSCIEALHCGLPMLISEHIGNGPEVLKNGENGYIFSYKDSRQAVALIEQIIKNDEQWYLKARNISLSIARQVYNAPKAISRCFSQMTAEDNVV